MNSSIRVKKNRSPISPKELLSVSVRDCPVMRESNTGGRPEGRETEKRVADLVSCGWGGFDRKVPGKRRSKRHYQLSERKDPMKKISLKAAAVAAAMMVSGAAFAATSGDLYIVVSDGANDTFVADLGAVVKSAPGSALPYDLSTLSGW